MRVGFRANKGRSTTDVGRGAFFVAYQGFLVGKPAMRAVLSVGLSMEQEAVQDLC